MDDEHLEQWWAVLEKWEAVNAQIRDQMFALRRELLTALQRSTIRFDEDAVLARRYADLLGRRQPVTDEEFLRAHGQKYVDYVWVSERIEECEAKLVEAAGGSLVELIEHEQVKGQRAQNRWNEYIEFDVEHPDPEQDYEIFERAERRVRVLRNLDEARSSEERRDDYAARYQTRVTSWRARVDAARSDDERRILEESRDIDLRALRLELESLGYEAVLDSQPGTS